MLARKADNTELEDLEKLLDETLVDFHGSPFWDVIHDEYNQIDSDLSDLKSEHEDEITGLKDELSDLEDKIIDYKQREEEYEVEIARLNDRIEELEG